MRVVFRTEGNHRQGMGDVMSSIAIAEEFRKRGDETRFIVSGGEAVTLIGSHGFAVTCADAAQAVDTAIREFRPAALVFNKLNNTVSELSAANHAGVVTVTVDDAGPAAELAHMRVNVLYDVPNSVRSFGFIALRPEFQRARLDSKAIREHVENMLIMQGGSDTYGFLPKIIAALNGMRCNPLLTVVIGPAFRHWNELNASLAACRLNYRTVVSASNICELMFQADVAISAGGISMFELACVGTPSIIVCAETFEEETAARLDREGAVINMGFGGNAIDDCLAARVDNLIENLELRRRMSARGQQLIDGRGAARIVDLVKQKVEETS